jgi:polysaccharide deacetylase family protein (PEP-CTERM system associated)
MGFKYDSSVFPVTLHDRYGIHSAPRTAHNVGSQLLEIPLSTIRAFGCNWPVAGGGYFRLMPKSFTSWAIRTINREGAPAVVYLHPWEFDPEQPRVSQAPLRSKFRHYINLHRTERRLRALVQKFSFAPIETVYRKNLARRCG